MKVPFLVPALFVIGTVLIVYGAGAVFGALVLWLARKARLLPWWVLLFGAAGLR